MVRFVFEMAGSGAPCHIESLSLKECCDANQHMLHVLTDDFLQLDNGIAFAAICLVEVLQNHAWQLKLFQEDWPTLQFGFHAVRLFLSHDGPELSPNPRNDVFVSPRYGKNYRLETHISAKKWQHIMRNPDSLQQLDAWKTLLSRLCTAIDSRLTCSSHDETFLVSVAKYPLSDLWHGMHKYLYSIDMFCSAWPLRQEPSPQFMLEFARAAQARKTTLRKCMFPKHLTNDKVFLNQLLEVNDDAYVIASSKLKHDKDFALAGASVSPKAFGKVPEELLTNEFVKQVLMSYSKLGLCSLQTINYINVSKDDDHIVQWFRQTLDLDMDFFLECVVLDSSVMVAVAETCSFDLILKAIRCNVRAFTWTFTRVKTAITNQQESVAIDDVVDVVIEALLRQQLSDQDALQAWTNVSMLVFQCCTQFSKASASKLRSYLVTCKLKRAVCTTAALAYFSTDVEVMCRCAQADAAVLSVSYVRQAVDPFMLEILRVNGEALAFCSPSMKHNKDVVLLATKTSPSSLAHACLELRKNHDVVLQAIHQLGKLPKAERPWHTVLKHACRSIACQPSIFQAAIAASAREIQYVDPLLVTKSMALDAVTRDRSVFQHLPESLQIDYDVVKVMAQAGSFLDNDKLVKIHMHPRLSQLW